MSNFDSGGGSENQWDERGELAWNEFDWDRYLRIQGESLRRYLSLYEAARNRPDRIDWVAERMGWRIENWTEEEEPAEPEAPAEPVGDSDEIYTLHQHPVYIATKAIYLSLLRSWRTLAGDAGRVSPRLALELLSSLHRGELTAVEAVHALDFGDYAMAVSLFKQALAELNRSLALLQDKAEGPHPALVAWREGALPCCFDLREIWLRVIAECRHELSRPLESDEE